MSYTQHGLIQVSDYNTYVGTATSVVANTLNTVNSAGIKQYGYGQPALSQLTIGNRITAVQWNLLINKIANLAKHQGSTITPLTLTAYGDPIAVQTTTAPITSVFQNNLNVIYANSGNAIAQSPGKLTSTVNSSSWYNHAGFTHVISFISGDAARNFFNAGGQIAVDFAHPTGNSSDSLWNALAVACGKIVLSSTITGSVSIAGTAYTGITQIGGAGGASSIQSSAGYYALSTTEIVAFSKSSAIGSISVSIKSNGSRGINGDTGNIITITTKWDSVVKGVAADGSFPSAGTTVNLTTIAPSITYLVNTWGTPTVVGTVLTGLDTDIPAPTITANWLNNPITIPDSATLSWTSTNAIRVTLGSTGESPYPTNGTKIYTDLGPKKYTYTDGFSQEFDVVGTNPGERLALAIAIGKEFFQSNREFTTTGGGKRYGLYRNPEPAGVVSWVDFCTSNSVMDPVTDQLFIDRFFITTLGTTAISGNGDSERSFQSSKGFNYGTAWGDFTDRPPNSGWWGIDPYTYTSWAAEYPEHVTNLVLAKKIVNNFYVGSGEFTLTDGSKRYGLYRNPDAAGLAGWVTWCMSASINKLNTQVLNPEKNQTFIDDFFKITDAGDLTRSTTQTKTFQAGGKFGNFYDRPALDENKMFNRAKTFVETVTAVGAGSPPKTVTITL